MDEVLSGPSAVWLFWLYWLGVGGGLGAAFVWLLRRFAPRRFLTWTVIGLVVAALIYVGFALTADLDPLPLHGLVIEIAGVVIFGAFAFLGWRRNPRWLAIGWMLHPIWDVWLHVILAGRVYTPTAYAAVCAAFDLVVGVAIWRLAGASSRAELPRG